MFKIIYAIGLIAMFIIRMYYRWRYRTNQIVENRKGTLEILLLSVAFIGMLVIPLTYVFTPLLSSANYYLSDWTGWLGTAVFAAALLLLWRTHADLERNWFQSLEIRKEHQIVTTGVYKYIRHPMYAAFLLWGIAQPLLLHNWIAGWSHLLSFGLLYFFRVSREEQMMLDQFGEEYRAYMNRTRRIIPYLLRRKK